MSNNPHWPEYLKLIEDAPSLIRCKNCKIQFPKKDMHPHHVEGRHGLKLLNFFWVCAKCHHWIHLHPQLAVQRGLLNPRNY
jgi:hypothetical protein